MQFISQALRWSAATTDPAVWGHMDGWGWGMAIFGLVFMAAIVGLVVWLITTTIRGAWPHARGRDAIDLLGERYARGDIDREEYLERRADLER